MALRKHEDTGHDLQQELADALDSIQARAEGRQADVRARLSELENEASVLGDVLGYLQPRSA
jgi:hypothetical protein